MDIMSSNVLSTTPLHDKGSCVPEAILARECLAVNQYLSQVGRDIGLPLGTLEPFLQGQDTPCPQYS